MLESNSKKIKIGDVVYRNIGTIKFQKAKSLNLKVRFRVLKWRQ